MKIVKVLVLLALVSASFQRKVEKKSSKSKMRWQDSYDCKLFIDEVEQGTGKFTPVSIQSPSSVEEKLGWVFNMSAGPNDALKNFMVQIGNSSKYYIPYRYITAEATLVNGTKNNKFIIFRVSADGSPIVTKALKVGLPYKTFGWYINEAESSEITLLVNQLRQQNQQLLNNAKSELTSNVNKYIDDLAALEASKIGDKALKNLVAKIKGDMDSIQKKIDDLGDQMENGAKEITLLESQLQSKQDTYNKQNLEIVQAQATITDGQAALDIVKNNSGNAASNVKSLTAAVTAAAKDFTSHIDILKKVCNVANAADDAKTAANNNDKAGIAKNINKIYA